MVFAITDVGCAPYQYQRHQQYQQQNQYPPLSQPLSLSLSQPVSLDQHSHIHRIAIIVIAGAEGREQGQVHDALQPAP
jgi:hypothetical protein